MVIKKIVSGGQTGADRAALDVAMNFGIPHGGWVPMSRRAEDGMILDKYEMQEMPTSEYDDRTERNVIDSDGTLIISHGSLKGGAHLTFDLAAKQGRPCLHIDLTKTNSYRAAELIVQWLGRHEIETLNVAGPRASQDPEIYGATKSILTSVFHLHTIETQMPDPQKAIPDQPGSVEAALSHLLSRLTLKDKTSIANLSKEELPELEFSLGDFIRNKFGLWQGNRELIESCRSLSAKGDFKDENAAALIIEVLWKRLRQTHRMRAVK